MSVKLLMLKNYPLMIPNLNFTIWKGYVKIMGNDYKMSINCPEFPFSRNVSIEVDQLSNLVQYCSIVNKLKSNKELKLHKFLDNFVDYMTNNLSNSSIDFNSKYLLYKDLETVRDNIVDISDTMDRVTLEYIDGGDRSHSFSIHMGPGAGKCFEMDLPEEIVHVFSEMNRLNPVSTVYKQFCQKVNDLQALFFMCDLLDVQTTVLEPATANPSRKHAHRKIGLSDSVAVEVRLNPYDVYSCPGIEVVGEGKSVAKVKTTLEQNMKEIGWDEDLNIIENLTRVLDVEEFPDLHARLACTQAQLGEGECSICLSMRHAVTMEAPVKLCSNEKCASFYHELCLSKWLQSIPTSDIGFGMVTGKCPLCKTTISCRLLDDDEDD